MLDELAGIIDGINTHGWVMHVHAPPGEMVVAHTLGLSLIEMPELVVVGLPFQIASSVLEEVVAYLVDHSHLAPGAGPIRGVLPGAAIYLLELVSPVRTLPTVAALAGEGFEGWQVVQQDTRGRWPWEPGADRRANPLLAYPPRQ